MSEVKIVGRGIDTLVLNVCYADKRFQPIKQELVEALQEAIVEVGLFLYSMFGDHLWFQVSEIDLCAYNERLC